MITRRDFIAKLMGGTAAVALSPLLDLAPIEPPCSLYFTEKVYGLQAIIDAHVPGTIVGMISPSVHEFWSHRV